MHFRNEIAETVKLTLCSEELHAWLNWRSRSFTMQLCHPFSHFSFVSFESCGCILMSLAFTILFLRKKQQKGNSAIGAVTLKRPLKSWVGTQWKTFGHSEAFWRAFCLGRQRSPKSEAVVLGLDMSVLIMHLELDTIQSVKLPGSIPFKTVKTHLFCVFSYFPKKECLHVCQSDI